VPLPASVSSSAVIAAVWVMPVAVMLTSPAPALTAPPMLSAPELSVMLPPCV
jgi:hypothetical protein